MKQASEDMPMWPVLVACLARSFPVATRPHQLPWLWNAAVPVPTSGWRQVDDDSPPGGKPSPVYHASRKSTLFTHLSQPREFTTTYILTAK